LWLDLAGYYEEKKNVIATEQVDPLTYRRAGPIEYWGVEAALEAHPTSVLTAFANVSYASDDSFTSADPDVALSSPSFKLRGGVDYGLPAGFSVGATAHYVDAFPVRAGPYVGTVDSYTLLDVRLRSTVPSVPGLSANVTAKNVLGNEHREFDGWMCERNEVEGEKRRPSIFPPPYFHPSIRSGFNRSLGAWAGASLHPRGLICTVPYP
jgi:iron complex outermembrane receptor protein